MVVSDTLDGLRAQFPACKLIAFADLSADMVLATSATSTLGQEHWDGLCAMARDVLRGPANAPILSCLGSAQSSLARAALISSQECNLFMTASQAPEYAFCVVGATDLGVAEFYHTAQPVLDTLAQDD